MIGVLVEACGPIRVREAIERGFVEFIRAGRDAMDEKAIDQRAQDAVEGRK